ncbi:unnamed protein product [Prunus brigantina]
MDTKIVYFQVLMNNGLNWDAKVADLFTYSRSWNLPLLDTSFCKEDCYAIASIDLACNTRAETDRVPRHVQWIKQGRKVRWIRKEGAGVLGGVFGILLEVLSVGLLAMVHLV